LALLLIGVLSALPSCRASRCFLPIKIHGQVFLWWGSNIPRKSFSHSRLPFKEQLEHVLSMKGPAAWRPWHCSFSKRYESLFKE
jgi:hypothetical protein